MSVPAPHCHKFLGAAAALMLLSAGAVSAQTGAAGTPPSDQSLENKGACDPASVAEAATKADTHSAAGTSPGNTGSTGWTGGTGGAHTATNPAGALPESKTWQPPTARGLDLAMAVPAKAPADNAGQAGKGC
ncbi:hypothetical protein SAMN03159496_02990 [Rhizobium sp. NFR07]|uniref:hypothetical protein n=1 Tax=Rhizobium sp. NFR07 TaxID=1566262 RepID=UPI0008EB3B6F|nr:hypothetical protein [Rhizobium sp. NFR07]SFB33167.1 hypothetical protein SAMN03159496_02990 [Rhizobium sp. NFR07]